MVVAGYSGSGVGWCKVGLGKVDKGGVGWGQ